jgi:hypothetical protein
MDYLKKKELAFKSDTSFHINIINFQNSCKYYKF